MTNNRRDFLKILGTATAASALPASIARALALPANHRTGTIKDVEHIVILMQENRSFDHYFGALRGVRGFNDPRAVTLPSGKSVFHQPDATNPDGFVLPFRPQTVDFGLKFLEDTAHGWNDTHGAWNDGKYDQWVPNKTSASMTYYTREDIPFHYALADAFTICDAYYCSVLGATDPNRYHMWSGWVGNDGNHVAPQGPVINNAEVGYNWSTYPEKLEAAGISWKVYQDDGVGLDAPGFWGFTDNAFIGNFGDNALLYFLQYQNAPNSSPLAQKARTGTDIRNTGFLGLFDSFAADVKNNSLPQVSWIVAPEAYTEHGNWPPNFGAWYVARVLDALTANPAVWSKTALLYMFDENDGFFDHMIPPTPPRSRAEGISTVGTTNEIFQGVPGSDYPPDRFMTGSYGLGVRVPLIVISPWSKGGFVNSQVFDHTSLIRFIEARFGVGEPNITDWRRTVTGDLTSAFDFDSPRFRVPALPSTDAYAPAASDIVAGTHFPDFDPIVPTNQSMPTQEPGTRRARPLPYELHVNGEADPSNGGIKLFFHNTGDAGAVFHVRSSNGLTGPWTYTTAAGDKTTDTLGSSGASSFDLAVYGPNGFFRAFAGGLSSESVDVSVETRYHKHEHGIVLIIHNRRSSPVTFTLTNAYTKCIETFRLHSHSTLHFGVELEDSFGWYDFTLTTASDKNFRRQLAGHVENGRPSVSDPAMGGITHEHDHDRD